MAEHEYQDKPRSYHYFDQLTGKQADSIDDLLPETHQTVRTAAMYAAENISVVWCWQCADTGRVGESWGPNEGCREFMTEPEIWYCTCDEGFMAKEAAYDREQTDLLLEAAHVAAQSAGYVEVSA